MLLGKRPDHIELPVELIKANPDQPRKVFNELELFELSESIKEFGIIQPIVVKKATDGSYLIIAGERRYRASRMAGLKKVPVVIRNADDKETAFISLIENVQRENLNYIEEAAAYKKLMDDYGLSQGEIARRVGKQQSTISNKIRLLSLPVEVQAILAEKELSERHARALLKVEDPKVRMQIIEKIADNNLNVKQSEKLIDSLIRKKEEEKIHREKLRFINYRIYINTIKQAFATVNEAEKEAQYFEEDKGDFLELKIIIPKREIKNRKLST